MLMLQMKVLHWILLAAIFLVGEVLSLGLTSIWFAGGALIAAVACALHAAFWIQILLFLAVSIVLLFITRPFAKKHLNSKTVKTNAESLIGEVGIVTISIDNLHAEGQVKIKGQEWTARSYADDVLIPEETRVIVLEITGVKLIVKPEEA